MKTYKNIKNKTKKNNFWCIFCWIICIISVIICIGVVGYTIIMITSNPDVFSITIDGFKDFIKTNISVIVPIVIIIIIAINTPNVKIKNTGIWFIDMWNI